MNGRAEHDAPFWCEENAWHLCVEPRVGEDASVVVITNAWRTVALWHQRAASRVDAPVVWDYHVIVVSRSATVWDLDTRLAFPVALDEYLRETFRSVAPRLRPRFRAIAAPVYRSRFASDRRHMRDAEGGWQQPPPPWPAIGDGHVLDALLDTDDDAFGPWLDDRALAAHVSGAP
jgi:hypothetical protein